MTIPNPPRRPARRASALLCLVAAGLTGALALTSGCSPSGSGEADTAGVDSVPSSSPPSSPTDGQSTPGDSMVTTFTDSFDDDRNGWALPPSDQGRSEVIDGDFVWESRIPRLRPHLLAATLADAYDQGRLEMTDVTVTASVTPQRGTPAMGVFCREVPDTDADFQWYEFVVRDGYAAIRQADLAGHLDVLAEGKADVPIGKTATIQATCVDGDDGTARLALKLNGDELLTTRTSDPLGNGVPGLQAYDSTEDQPADRFLIAWHDFSIEPATGP